MIQKQKEADQQSAAGYAHFEQQLEALHAQRQELKAELQVAHSEYSVELKTAQSPSKSSRTKTQHGQSKLPSSAPGSPKQQLASQMHSLGEFNLAKTTDERSERSPSPSTGHSEMLEQERLNRKPVGYSTVESTRCNETSSLDMPSPVRPLLSTSMDSTSWAATTDVGDTGFKALETRIAELERELVQSMNERVQLQKQACALEQEAQTEQESTSMCNSFGFAGQQRNSETTATFNAGAGGEKSSSTTFGTEAERNSLAATAARACAKREGHGISFVWPRWEYQANQRSQSGHQVRETQAYDGSCVKTVVNDSAGSQTGSPWSASPFRTPVPSRSTARSANGTTAPGSPYQSRILRSDDECTGLRSPNFGRQPGEASFSKAVSDVSDQSPLSRLVSSTTSLRSFQGSYDTQGSSAKGLSQGTNKEMLQN